MKKFYKIIAVLMATLIMAPWLALAEGEDTDGEGGESETSGVYENENGADGVYENSDGSEIFTCTSGQYESVEYIVDEDAYDDTTSAANEENALISRVLEDFEKGLAESGNVSCGETNPYTGDVLMGDCAADGKVVSEVSQSFAGDTTLGDEASVKTLYKGSCCFIVEMIVKEDGELYYECRDQRTQYFEDPETCYQESIYCTTVQWIIGDSGASIIKLYIKQIYMWAAGTIGFIAVITIVINGIRISVSGASGDITQAKERILQSISGLVLLFLSGLILYTINPTFFS